jgi:hypothetical protein
MEIIGQSCYIPSCVDAECPPVNVRRCLAVLTAIALDIPELRVVSGPWASSAMSNGVCILLDSMAGEFDDELCTLISVGTTRSSALNDCIHHSAFDAANSHSDVVSRYAVRPYASCLN